MRLTLKLRLAIASAIVIALSVAVTVMHSVKHAQDRAEASIVDSNLGAAQLAATLSARIIDRQRALLAASRDWPRGERADPERARAFVARQAVLRALFNDALIVPSDGMPEGATSTPTVSPPVGGLSGPGSFSVLLTVPLPTGEPQPPLLAGALQLDATNLLSNEARVAELDASGGLATVIADQGGRVLAHADPTHLMTLVDDDPRLHDAVARWRRQGSPLEPTPWTERFGDRFVAMAAVPGTEWMLFRIASVDSLSGDASRATSRIMLLGLAVGLGGALTIFCITAWFLRPMAQLRRRAMKAMDPGQAAADGWPEAGGEIGELSRALRDVSVQLAAGRLAMDQSLQRMQAVLTHAPVGIAFTDAGRIELASSHLQRMFGCEDAEVEGAPWDSHLPPEMDSRTLRDAAEEAFRDGRPFEIEVPLRRSDGSVLWAHVHGAVVRGARERCIWIVADVTDARRRREALMWSASHDALTDLVNRREFERQLGLVLGDRRRHEPTCLMFIDLDHFKQVNDGAGHAAGDAILQRVAQALRQRLREEDTIARLGGDEFAVLLRGCDLARAQPVAEGIRALVQAQGVCEADPSLGVTASIGLVEIEAAHASLAEVLEAADRACYAAKHAGRNAVRTAAVQPPQTLALKEHA